MRTKLLALLALVLALPIALGQGRTLIIAQGTDPTTLDAPLATDSPSATVVNHVVETLFEYTPDGKIQPLLVERYSFSSDRKTLTLYLRKGIKFHDGTDFNAEAVKFNLERLISQELASAFAFLLRGRVTAFEVVDSHTLRLRMPEPFAPVLAHLTHSSTGIQSPTAIRRLGVGYRDNPVGTGPYKFDRWQKGQFVELVRNEDYWGRKPAIERLRFLAVPEAATRMALVETGQAHVAVRVPPQDVQRLNARPEIEVVTTPSVRTIFFYFNQSKKPFDDIRVRKAINHAINKEEIVKFVLGGFGRVSDAPISPGIFGYTKVGSYEYNPNLARQLLAQAGYTAQNPLRITIHSPNGRYLQDIRVTEAVQSQLRAVGVQAQIQTLEWGAYLAATNQPRERNEIQMAMLGWGTVTGDADYGLYGLFHSSQQAPNGFNRGFYANPRLDRVLEQARVATNPQARQQLYRTAMQIIYNDVPWVFLHSEQQVTAIRREVQGFVVHPTERLIASGASFRTSAER
ncbi:Glutathione-binding protein GsiB [Meiothermus luteus]|jgi:peptide/nickel transport system substrate-binding protein|uniref:Glutathione-binding protein GsiB n=1 Tax=Meiothermus luteus TaxID=2026184 RepID=A0A399ENF6_9DEIN|nr:glutathione ABC transporter substrate-binding protein [Meiothermus luteus]RIH85415.1 Glutathione-binding protein GsiB [Meiothermus luteus]RMH57114.1 MAG: glutathione ABC transporter substrate-binding protein [Deinococcota bacterium]